MNKPASEAFAEIGLAAQFLTRLSVPQSGEWRQDRMKRTPQWYPLVGVFVGSAAALAYLAASQVFGANLAALAALTAGMLLTGCLHEDGLADVCDALGAKVSRERTLEIMRDSRIGTYGAIGLGVVIGATALSLGAMPVAVATLALIAAHAASRASMALVIATGDYVRPEGAASSVAGGVSRGGVVVAIEIAAIALLPLAFSAPAAMLTGLLGLALGHALMRLWYGARLHGYTGDCLGAVQQMSALGFLLGVAAWS